MSYQTLVVNNGARHIIVPGYHMGPSIDGESDGQPSGAADGDDINLFFPGVPDDEDGVYIYPLVPGLMSAMDVTVTGTGKIDAWIDFDQNGTFGGAGEQIVFSTVVNPGANPNQLTFPVPSGLGTGATIARIRFSSVGGLNPWGQAPDGEVEDYEVKLLPENAEVYDYGDAPDPLYPTLNFSGGAAHVIGSGPILGLVPTRSGVVVYAGWNDWGYGYVIVLDHGNGWQTLYAHLSTVNVVCGQSVYQGDVIGAMGSTGNSTGAHLHFEIMHDEYGKVNPHNFLQ